MKNILIGNMVLSREYDKVLPILARDGFESISLNLADMQAIESFIDRADAVREQLKSYDIKLSSVSFFGNPIDSSADRACMEKLLYLAAALECDTITGFTGALRGKPMDQSIEPYVKIFGPMAARAADMGIRIAFENCPMGGTWNCAQTNIAINPDAWDLLFDALPAENIGLQWEPAHQLEQLIDPYDQIPAYISRIFLLHGKDANVEMDVIRKHGISSPVSFCAHRFPGYGDSDWAKIISMLSRCGFSGSVDIEGWHDPVYKGDIEYTGQLYALHYLKQCRDTGTMTCQVNY